MNGLQATKLIRSFEETGTWDAARNAGIEQSLPDSDYECSEPTKKRIPIVAVSNQSLYKYISKYIDICDEAKHSLG